MEEKWLAERKETRNGRKQGGKERKRMSALEEDRRKDERKRGMETAKHTA